MTTEFDVDTAVLAGSVEGAGPPFVWLHALTSSRRRELSRGIYDWSPLTEEFTLVRYDARGHGGSTGQPDPDHYQWRRLGHDLLDVIDSVGTAPVAVGGASMGAVTTLWACLESPAAISALVLATPPAAWYTKERQAAGWRKAAHIIEKYGSAELARRTAGMPPAPLFEGHPELADSASDVDESLLPSVLRGAADSDLPEPALIAEIQVPVLILAWTGDPDHPVSTAHELGELLPNSELHVASRIEDTRQWTSLARSFLQETAR